MFKATNCLKVSFKSARDEASNTALTEEARNKFRTEAEEKLVKLREQENTIRKFDESRRRQLEEQGRRMRKRIVEEIREHLVTYSRRQGYAAVFDISGQSLNGVEMILYKDPKLDITDEVIEILNKGQQATP